MSNRHTTPRVGGAARADELGHTMVIGPTGSGKTTALYDMLRLTETEFRIVKGQPDTGAVGDEACV
ncbi:type IV secretion system DNA-binding domain-containing protein [Burkholderia ambifaria]|uniref:type IV secretion system DNA-binding domain-containing protein n=1 Tax=Burkholderia ambifaria TaxID=152480 RepID=UPI00158B9845|nr:type IV secretion system DNA-binding domain-containing protein [Burkholderia ambifaria]